MSRLPVLLTLLSLTLVSIAITGTYKSGESVFVNAGDTVYNDFFAGAKYVEIEGVVNADVFVGAQTFRLEGEVEDDAIAACKEVEIRGKVGDMVVGFGERIVIEGEVEGDVLAWGGYVRITKTAVIKGDVYVGAGEFSLEGGKVLGDINGGAGEVVLDGEVSGRVELETGKASFRENYSAALGTYLTMDSENIIGKEYAGDDFYIEIEEKSKFFSRVFFVWSFMAMLVVGILMVSVFKNFSRDIITHARENVLKKLGIGFAALILVPVVAIILMVLIVTIPVGLILFGAYFLVFYLSTIFSSLYVGDYLFNLIRKNGRPFNIYLILLVGLIITFLICEIPFVGWLFGLVIICFGMGNFLLYMRKLFQSEPKVA